MDQLKYHTLTLMYLLIHVEAQTAEQLKGIQDHSMWTLLVFVETADQMLENIPLLKTKETDVTLAQFQEFSMFKQVLVLHAQTELNQTLITQDVIVAQLTSHGVQL